MKQINIKPLNNTIYLFINTFKGLLDVNIRMKLLDELWDEIKNEMVDIDHDFVKTNIHI